MAKYRCSKKKQEILEIIVNHFRREKEEYDRMYDNNNVMKVLRRHQEGRYDAMLELLWELEIYED